MSIAVLPKRSADMIYVVEDGYIITEKATLPFKRMYEGTLPLPFTPTDQNKLVVVFGLQAEAIARKLVSGHKFSWYEDENGMIIYNVRFSGGVSGLTMIEVLDTTMGQYALRWFLESINAILMGRSYVPYRSAKLTRLLWSHLSTKPRRLDVYVSMSMSPQPDELQYSLEEVAISVMQWSKLRFAIEAEAVTSGMYAKVLRTEIMSRGLKLSHRLADGLTSTLSDQSVAVITESGREVNALGGEWQSVLDELPEKLNNYAAAFADLESNNTLLCEFKSPPAEITTSVDITENPGAAWTDSTWDEITEYVLGPERYSLNLRADNLQNAVSDLLAVMEVNG